MLGCQIDRQFDPTAVEAAIGGKSGFSAAGPQAPIAARAFGTVLATVSLTKRDQEVIKLTTRSLAGCVGRHARHPSRAASL